MDISTELANLTAVGPYFTVGTGVPGPGRWRSTARLYTDRTTLATVVSHVGREIGTDERRVAASTLFLGYAARLWSISLGAVVRSHVLPLLAPDDLLWHEEDGRIALHLPNPRGVRGSDLTSAAQETVLDRHLAPLIAALASHESVSPQVLWGNTASALLSAAQILDGGNRDDRAMGAAVRILRDPRLANTVEPDSTGYRRRSCCLFYRTPASGYCGDCVLTGPRRRSRRAPREP